MPTRCNRGFYCRSYCPFNMFRAPLCPSSGAQEYYTVVAACGISCCGFQVVGLVWSWGLCVRFAGCLLVKQRLLLQILFLPQHVSGITMPIIRSSRVLYSGCCLWYFVLWFSSCSAPHLTSNLKTTAPNTTGSNHCRVLLSSWWWA